jgi:predicted ATPase
MQGTGMVGGQTPFLVLLADAYQNAQESEAGLNIVEGALALADQAGEHVVATALYRLKGEFLLQQKRQQTTAQRTAQPLREAEACFQKALGIAQRQEAKSEELRSAVHLSRLWQQQGKTTEAHQLLSEVYGWFTEGFETVDLQEAKALLETLGG